MTIAQKIRQLREQAGMTQVEIARSLGISQQAYSQYESGRRRPKMETLFRFADALDVSFTELMSGVDFLPNDESPGHGFYPAFSVAQMVSLKRKAEQLQKNGTAEELQTFREELEKSMEEMLDSSLLSVFHTLSNVNKQKAISYCEGLASTQPGYEYADTRQNEPPLSPNVSDNKGFSEK